jgi:2-dehydropantoate 2-reductase
MSTSPAPDDWPRFAVVGAGAVGCYFGGMLARAGAPVTLIGRARHVDAIAANGLEIDSVRFRDRVSRRATTEPDGVRGAAIVLLTVKGPDTESAVRAVRPHLQPGASLFSVQNGVDTSPRSARWCQVRLSPR